MHIPDGLLSPPVWAALQVASVPAVGFMARRARIEADESRLPLFGVMGAFVFAAQMVNFPVGAGTSGHLLGGALLAVTLGPAAACLVMTAILIVQALIFGDGGVLALGANTFNMAVLGVLAGYLPYHFWGGTAWRRAAVFAGAALSVLTGACLALVQLILSGAQMPRAVVALSLAFFLVTAAIEGAITLVVFEAIERLNPHWVREPGAGNRAWGLLAAGAIVLGLLGAVFASTSPDVLESLTEQTGLAGQAMTLFSTPLADYEFAGVQTPWVRKSLAGLAGLAIIYVVCVVSARLLRRRAAR